MKKGDKVIIIFYIFLAISVIGVYLYLDTVLLHNDLVSILPQPITEFEFTRSYSIENEILFGLMTDVSKYPVVLPRNVISVNIIEHNDNVIIAEETVQEKGISLNILSQHTIIPYEEHIIEILDGDARGTKVVQTFTSTYNEGPITTINTKVDVKLHGFAQPFAYLPKANIVHAADTVYDSFFVYAQGFDSSYEETVDKIYREILLRQADQSGLDTFSILLENGEITEDEIRQQLLDSDEYVYVVNFLTSSSSELHVNTKKTVNSLYYEILLRPADELGMRIFGSQLESGDLTEGKLRLILINSDEAYHLRLDSAEKIIMDDLIRQVFDRRATYEELEYFEYELTEGSLRNLVSSERNADFHGLLEFELIAILTNMKENGLTIDDLKLQN